MRKIKWLTLGIVVIFVLVLLVVLSNQNKLPMYQEINNVKSDTPNFVKHYLVRGNQKYVSDANEFCMEVTKKLYGKAVGATSGEGKVYSVDSKMPPNYVVLKGFMIPDIIYRNISVPPIDYLNSDISELQIRENQGWSVKKKTNDKKIITEVQENLRKPKYVDFKGYDDLYHITLISPKASVLGYMVYVAIDKERNVYLEDFDNRKPIKAGSLFTAWVLSKD